MDTILVRSVRKMTSSRFHGVFGPLLAGKSSPIAADDSVIDAVDEDTLSVPTEEELHPVDLQPEAEDSVPSLPVASRSGGAVGQIAMDMYDEGDYIILRTPIAGVKLADLDIDVVGNRLTVSGSREETEEVPSGRMYLEECYWGAFSRTVDLPFSPNPSRVKATFNKESILKIYIPKEKKVKIVRINEGG